MVEGERRTGISMDSIIGDDIVSSVRGTVQHIVQLAADPDAQEALMSMDGTTVYIPFEC